MNIELIPCLTSYWPEIREFFNSVFFTAIAGSLAGAFAGAYGAQRIAERGKYRDELVKEIRNTNAASSIVFSVCNSLISLKKQHVKHLKQDFDTQKAALLDFSKKRKTGEISKDVIFHFAADFQTLSLPKLPVDILQDQIFEKLSLTARPLHLTTTLTQTVHSLNASFEKRNQLIESYKAANETISAPLYFGLPQGDQINQDYPSLIDAIYRQTDDGIFFSELLGKDLVEHGEHTAEQFKKRFGKGAPPIRKADFGKARDDELMPKADDYADWFTMFVKDPSSKPDN